MAVSGESVLASGRDADLLDLGGGRVLRRPRVPRPLDGEAEAMRRAREAGYPAPEVLELRPDGMVMERVDGPTMLDDLAAHPWRVRRHARMLASLHRRLHAIADVDGLRAPLGEPRPDDVIVHGDLHPANVLLSASGPVVIDWAGAGRGQAGADVADAWLLLASAQPPAGALMRAVVGLLRGRFLAAFLRDAGREEAAGHLRQAVERRVADHHMTAAEAASMRRVAERYGRG